MGARRPFRADGRRPAPCLGHAERRSACVRALWALGAMGARGALQPDGAGVSAPATRRCIGGGRLACCLSQFVRRAAAVLRKRPVDRHWRRTTKTGRSRTLKARGRSSVAQSDVDRPIRYRPVSTGPAAARRPGRSHRAHSAGRVPIRLDHRQRGHVHDPPHGRARCEDVHRRIDPQQERPDRDVAAGFRLQQVVSDVPRIDVRAHEQVRRALQRRHRQQSRAQRFIERTVAMHLAICFEIRRMRTNDFQRLAHFRARRRAARSEVRPRQQRRLRRQVQPFHLPRGRDRELRDLLGIRIVVDVRIHERDRPLIQQQDIHRRVGRCIGLPADHFIDEAQMIVILANRAADHPVRVAEPHHHRADQRQAPPHFDARHLLRNSVAATQFPIGGPVLREALVVFRVRHLDVLTETQPQAEPLDPREQHLRTAHQDRTRKLLVDDYLHRAQHALVLAFGEHDACVAAIAHELARGREQRLHERAGVVDELLQLLDIRVEIRERARRHAAFDRRLRDGRRDAHDQARVERLRNQVLRTERHFVAAVRGRDDVVLLFLREPGDRVNRGDFHFARDRRGTHVQRAAEDVREAQHVVDLVREIRAAGRDHDVVARRMGELGKDLRRRVRERENQRPRGHRLQHLRFQNAADRQAEKHVGAADHFGQRTRIGFLCEALLRRVHQRGTAAIDDAFDVRRPDVRDRQPQVDQQVQASERGGACARRDDLHFLDRLADHLQSVDERGRDGNRRAVLVVVEHGNLHALAQLALDGEAFRRLDVFEVDAAERGLEAGDDVDELVRVRLVDLDVEHVDAGELLEQHGLAFHDRLRRERADVAQTQHRGAVRDDAHQISAAREAVRVQRLGGDRLADARDARRVREREIALRDERLAGDDGDLPRGRKLVVVERGLLLCLCLFHGCRSGRARQASPDAIHGGDSRDPP
ncbi:hypothetical protein BLAT2472_80176 [Burkholderia latens]